MRRGQGRARSGQNQSSMTIAARDVLEADLHDVGGHSIARSLGPFDEDDRSAVDEVVPRKVREIIRTAQPVKVQMKDGCALCMIFVHERERRTGHIFANSNTAANGLGERRLSRAEVTFERDDHRRPESSPEFLAPLLQLVNRESRIVNRGNPRLSYLWPLASFPWPHLLARIAANASRRRGVASRFALRSNTSSRRRAASSKSSSSAADRISSSSWRIISSSCSGLYSEVAVSATFLSRSRSSFSIRESATRVTKRTSSTLFMTLRGVIPCSTLYATCRSRRRDVISIQRFIESVMRSA